MTTVPTPIPTGPDWNPLKDAACSHLKPGTRLALYYACVHQWPVFPVSRFKQPLIDNGFYGATTSIEQIVQWWEVEYGDSEPGVGFPPAAVGLAVVDVDVSKADPTRTGHDTLRMMKRVLPPTLTSVTPSGGQHFFYNMPDEGLPSLVGEHGLGALLDVRGGTKPGSPTGYVILPGSGGPGLRGYEWLDTREPADLPQWVTESVKRSKPSQQAAGDGHQKPVRSPERYAEKVLEYALAELREASTGGRNHATNKAAFAVGRVLDYLDLSMEEAVDALMDAAPIQETGREPFTSQEAEATIRHGLEDGAADPLVLVKEERTATEKLLSMEEFMEESAPDPWEDEESEDDVASGELEELTFSEDSAEEGVADESAKVLLAELIQTNLIPGIDRDELIAETGRALTRNQAMKTAREFADTIALPPSAEDDCLFLGEALESLPETGRSVWGNGHRIAWAMGEPLLIAAGTGRGKSTITQQIIAHGVGAREGAFLGMDVAPFKGLVLYLALDRPEQIKHSFKRFFLSDPDTVDLISRNVVFKTQLRQKVNNDPYCILKFVEEWEAKNERKFGVIVVDSLKDISTSLDKTVDGIAVHAFYQSIVSSGYELVVMHHSNKNREKKGLERVSGNHQITDGAGSVLFLDSPKAGATSVTLEHLKQPGTPITGDDDKWHLLHDHTRITTEFDPNPGAGGGTQNSSDSPRQRVITMLEASSLSKDESQNKIVEFLKDNGIKGKRTTLLGYAKQWKAMVDLDDLEELDLEDSAID